MKILHKLDEMATVSHGSTSIALGFFDGVHVGHRAVLAAAAEYAQAAGLVPAVFTFTLPGEEARASANAALEDNGRAGALPAKGMRLCTPQQKYERLAAAGMQLCFEPAFSEFYALQPEAFFTEWLQKRFGAGAVFCGDNFHFGAGRTGTPQTLQALCRAQGIHFADVPIALYDGQPVSSSRIRAALAAGNMAQANVMLGAPYEIFLPVRHGRRYGSAHGFPTINQVLPVWLQAPKAGVYISQTWIKGKGWPSATGYGTRPTVSGKMPTCETFIPDFAGNLYGEPVRVQLFEYIDEPHKFASGQELAAAVHTWAQAAKAWFAHR